jgi:threonine dehydratase
MSPSPSLRLLEASPYLDPVRSTARLGERLRAALGEAGGRQSLIPSATVELTMQWQVPTLADVLEARRRISPHLRPTPLYGYGTLNELLDADVFVKHENHQPIGAFKVRGGVNLISQLTAKERERGVIAASTGNHGQSIAYAARLFGVRATICVPENANPVKVASMRGLGAELVFHGRDFDEAREQCEQLAHEHGYRYVHSGNEPLLIAGVGTHTLEILEEQPELDTIIVPVGGGSGAAGACIVAKAVDPTVRVIGVQSEAAPAAFRSWQERRLIEDRMETFAEGLATRTAFELPQRILWQWLDDFVLVTDDEIRAAQATMIEATRNLVEAAGAAPLAAALRLHEQLASKRIALIASGGNVSREQLLDVLAGEHVPAGAASTR